MKIIVFSDSHGSYSALEKIYELHPNADLYLHLGDGERDFDKFILNHQGINFMHVAGNCDFASLSPDFSVVFAPGGHKIFITHGHRYDVKYTYSKLKLVAKENGCDIAFFGHTHIPHTEYEDGFWLLNPGSALRDRYAIAEISEKGVLLSLAEVY